MALGILLVVLIVLFQVCILKHICRYFLLALAGMNT
jgi:hypothetical protein